MTSHTHRARSRAWPALVALAALGASTAAAVATRERRAEEAGAPASELDGARRLGWQRTASRLHGADREARGRIDARIGEVRAFFAEREAGCRELASAVLSLRGKWAFVRSRLPLADEDRYVRFLREEFGERIFTPDELRAAVEGAVEGFLYDLEAIENRLLVDVRADLEDLPPEAFPAFRERDGIRLELERALHAVEVAVAEDARADVTRETASLLAGEVAARVALGAAARVGTRLGVSGGILGAGAASSWASFGATIVAAVLVDLALERAIRMVHDPEAEVAAQLAESLDRVQALVVEGDGEVPGLAEELARLHERRSELRRGALRGLVLEPEGIRP